MRAVVELAGVKDVLGKSLGNPNPINLARATIDALAMLRDPETTSRRPRVQAQAHPAAEAAVPAVAVANPRSAPERSE